MQSYKENQLNRVDFVVNTVPSVAKGAYSAYSSYRNAMSSKMERLKSIMTHKKTHPTVKKAMRMMDIHGASQLEAYIEGLKSTPCNKREQTNGCERFYYKGAQCRPAKRGDKCAIGDNNTVDDDYIIDHDVNLQRMLNIG